MKKLLLKTGTYTNNQGETKNNYVELGVILQGNDGGEYAIIEPTVDLAGVLIKQNTQALKDGKEVRDSIMCGIFDKQQNNQQPQQGYQQHPNQTGGFQQSPQAAQHNYQQQNQNKPPF